MDILQWQRLVRIVSKHLWNRTPLEDSEQSLLEEWKRNTWQSEQLLRTVSDFDFLSAKRKTEERFSWEDAWGEFKQRQRSWKRKRKWRYIGYASMAACAILILGWNVFWEHRQIDLQSQIPVLEAGLSRAVLILENGKTVDLGAKRLPAIFQQAGSVTVNTYKDSLLYAVGNTQGRQLVYNTLSIPRKGEYKLILADGTKI